MKILYLFKSGRENRIGAGGPSEFFYGMLQLEDLGHDVTMVLDCDIGCDQASPLIWRPFHRLGQWLTGIPIWPSICMMPGERRKKLEQGDCLIATTSTFGICLALLARFGLVRTKVLILAMGLLDRSTSRRVAAVYRWLLRDPVHVVALSDANAAYLSKILGRKIPFIPFGVDTSFWQPTDNQNDHDGEAYVLSIGNDLNRDYSTLVAAWKPYYPMLRIVTSLPVACDKPNITIIHGSWHTQVLDDQDIRKLMQHALFVVLPIGDTIQPSGQSASLQAMACSKTVVVTDYRGLWNRDVMRSGETCVLAGTPGSVIDLQSAIEKLLSAPEVTGRIGRRAAIAVRNDLTVRHMGRRLETVIDNIVNDDPHQSDLLASSTLSESA